jgi:cephalosporin hydroxylase
MQCPVCREESAFWRWRPKGRTLRFACPNCGRISGFHFVPEASDDLDGGLKARSVDLWAHGGWRNSRWLGQPILQLPEDLFALQEIIWDQHPDVIVETGVYKGGSAIFYASMLALTGGQRVVSVELSVDPEIRTQLAEHPLGERVVLVEGDSVAPGTLSAVEEAVAGEHNVLVAIDSNHSREHVRRELEAYSSFVPLNGWLVAFDGVMEWLAAPDVDPAFGAQPSWTGDNPLPAIHDFAAAHPEFEITDLSRKFGATFAPDGFLRRIS